MDPAVRGASPRTRMPGVRWSADEERVAWAAGLWSRAFDAKKAVWPVVHPEASLSPVEAAERLCKSGL